MVTRNQINNALYNAIRLVCVASGHLPDVSQYSTLQAYQQAKRSLKATGTIVVEVYPVGSKQERNPIEQATIIVDHVSEESSLIGGGFRVVDNEGSEEAPDFKAKLVPATTWNVDLIATYVTQDRAIDILCAGIIDKAWQSKTYFKGLNNDLTEGDSFLFRRRNTVDLSVADYIERQFRGYANGVYLDPVITTENLPTMTDLSFSFNPL